MAASLALSGASLPARAQENDGNKVRIIRDTEIEQLLRDYLRPILKVAGLSSGHIKVVLIPDRSFNAFVADGRHIYVNTGALMDAKTPNEIIGVLAHECGHLAGGHLLRRHEEIANAQIFAAVGMLLGGAAMVGGRNSIGDAGRGGAGIMMGAQEMAQRSLLSYQRSEEEAADRAAVRFLDATQQSPRGLVTVFKRFADDAIFKTASIDPYLQSHPLPQVRIANLENLVAKSPYRDKKDPPALQERHELMRAKLYGFLASPGTVYRKYPPSDDSLPARYARAIAAHRSGNSTRAISLVDGLIKDRPGDPYFWELKGQILLESARPGQALAPLRKAISMVPDTGLIRAMYGRALLATDDPKLLQDAIRELSNAAARDPDSADTYRDLGIAYGRTGKIGLADANTAEFYFKQGEWSEAATLATRAMAQLPKGSPGWVRAKDIVDYRPHRTSQRP